MNSRRGRRTSADLFLTSADDVDNRLREYTPLSSVQSERTELKGKGPVLDIAPLHDEHMLRSALQSRKWQLIGMS